MVVDYSVTAGLAVTMVALIILVVLDWWVYADAQARQRARDPVEVQLGAFEIDAPRVWLAGCVLLFVVFFPLYLVARRQR